MEIRLRPMREDEFAAFLTESKGRYARDMVENGGVDAEAAHTKAEDAYARLLPDGLGSAGQFLYVIEDESGQGTGTLWFADQLRFEQRCAYLYDIYVVEALRGQHIGRQAMQLLEQEVSTRGLKCIELNVFGGNTVARSLYRSLGYAETFVGMRKHLDTASQAR